MNKGLLAGFVGCAGFVPLVAAASTSLALHAAGPVTTEPLFSPILYGGVLLERSGSATAPAVVAQSFGELQPEVVRASTGTWLISSGASAHRYIGMEQPTRANHLMEGRSSRTVGVAYAWRGLVVESVAQSTNPDPRGFRSWRDHDDMDGPSRSTRFSYQIMPQLSLHFSRGTWSPVDEVATSGEIKRTSLAASYVHRITGGEWKTTVAWGRSANKGRPSLYGYLAESSVRFSGSNVAFGRVEQIGVNDLARLELPYAFHRKAYRVSVGYFHELAQHRGSRIGAGMMASRYFLPMPNGSDGAPPATLMFFMHVKLR